MTGGQGRKLRVLLAEDNPVNQQITAAMLVKRGHEVDVVGDGRAAVDAVRARTYDVVVMDVQMPGLDGFAATDEIRSDPEHVRLPIIAMTAHANREQCLARGMTDYLSKPFAPDDLFRAVERAGSATAASAAPVADPAPGPVAIETLRAALREGGVEDVLGTLVATFTGDAPGRMRDLETALEGGDGEAINHTAHAYKSAAATIRATQLASLLQQTERAGGAGAVDEARHLGPAVRAEHDRVMQFLQDFEGRDPQGDDS